VQSSVVSRIFCFYAYISRVLLCGYIHTRCFFVLQRSNYLYGFRAKCRLLDRNRTPRSRRYNIYKRYRYAENHSGDVMHVCLVLFLLLLLVKHDHNNIAHVLYIWDARIQRGSVSAAENVGNRKPRVYRRRVEFNFLTMLRGVCRKYILFVHRLDTYNSDERKQAGSIFD